MALKNKRIPVDRAVEPVLAAAIWARSKGGRLDCAVALSLAKEKDISPLVVGEAADSLGIHLSHCQLGLFGFPGRAKAWESPSWKEAGVHEGLEEGVRSALEPDGSLPCAAAWDVAGRFGVGRAQLGILANRLRIKIKRCQLGAF